MLVLCFHFPAVTGKGAACEVVICGDLLEYFDEGWDLELRLLLGGLDSEKGDRLVDIGVGIDEEVLLFVNEALTEDLQADVAWRGLIEHLNVLTS